MIVWRGWGILVIIIPAVIWGVVPELFKVAMPEAAYSSAYPSISALGILLGGLALWFLGRKLNAGGRVLVDEQTGEKVVLKPGHSLFFINMEYWAIPLFALFVLMLFV